jgi:hypothetical protein
MASGHVNRTNRPNTWPLRPTLQSEDSSCQPGAVHTWPIVDMERPDINVVFYAHGGRDNSGAYIYFFARALDATRRFGGRAVTSVGTRGVSSGRTRSMRIRGESRVGRDAQRVMESSRRHLDGASNPTGSSGHPFGHPRDPVTCGFALPANMAVAVPPEVGARRRIVGSITLRAGT